MQLEKPMVRENPQKKETQEIQDLLENCRSRVKIIRTDPWPLIDYNIDFSSFYNLSLKYKIPDFVVGEIFSVIKSFGFVDGVNISLDEDSKKVVTDGKRFVNDIIGIRENSDFEYYSFLLDKFFKKLSNMQIIKDIISQGLDLQSIPYGLFRFSSLFDIKVQKFSDLADFLNFLLENLEAQENIFGEKFIENIAKNGGFPIDDIIGKEKLFRNSQTNISLGELDLFGKKVGLNLRIIPGYGPPGLVFELGLEIDGKTINTFVTIGISFENGAAIIHTIQYSIYNIGLENDEIFETQDKQKNISGKISQRLVSNIGENIFEKESADKSPIKFLLALTGNILQNFGVKQVEVINPSENLWLNNHNPNRDKKSLEKSGEAQYVSLPRSLGGKVNLENGRIILDFGELQFFLSTQIKSKFLENFGENISNFYIESDFFKNSGIVNGFSDLSEQQKESLGESIYNIIRKIKNYV